MSTVSHGVTNQKDSAFNYDITLSHTTANHRALQFLSHDLVIQSEYKQIND